MTLEKPRAVGGKARIALVVQRYGPEIDGGSETLCREVAERLCASFEVEVLTTTASDYLTWKNDFRPGVQSVNGVDVRRFAVASRRRVRSFGKLSNRLYATAHSIEEEVDWMIRQGPRALDLLDYVKRAAASFDAFVFFTYLYYPTYFGLPLVAGKSVLVPTLHDEPPAHLDIFRTLFRLPRTFVWNTPEEQALAQRMFGIPARGEVAGIGIELDDAPHDEGDAFRAQHGLGEFLLYVGRLDVWKGVPELIELFGRYRAERAPTLSLVLVGKENMRIPQADGVRALGFLPESDKRAAFRAASATMVPSAFESLSVVALESWAAGTPVVASARSEAVAGQCARSGGGITYASYEDFRDALDRVRSAGGRLLGARGREFVAGHCTWEHVIGVYGRAIEIAAGTEA